MKLARAEAAFLSDSQIGRLALTCRAFWDAVGESQILDDEREVPESDVAEVVAGGGDRRSGEIDLLRRIAASRVHLRKAMQNAPQSEQSED